MVAQHKRANPAGLRAVHVGREECNNVYIERDKSTDAVTGFRMFILFGAF